MTERPSAELATRRAIRAYNTWRVDTMDHVSAALELDPEYPMAHLVRGLALATGRSRRYQPMIEDSLASARECAGRLEPHERPYVDALAALAAGRNTEAVVHYERVLAARPDDLFAHRLAQQELFWMGDARWMADVAESGAGAFAPDHPDYGAFCSVRAFSLEEAGDRRRAEALAREAIERDPTDCWGAHAGAHVFEMEHRVDEGVEWLEGLVPNWVGGNQIVHHLWWHLCLFLLEGGEHGRVLELLDTEVRNPDSPLVRAVPDLYIDLQNAASLLLRLELRGVDVGDRWAAIAEMGRGRIGNHASPFTDAHAAMILAAAGEAGEAEALIESMEAFAAGDRGALGPRYRMAGIPAARAAVAHRRGEHAEVAAALLPARRHLWVMGGSHAQRDVFHQILVDSLRRIGDEAGLRRVLAEVGSRFDDLRSRSFYAAS